MAMSVLRVRLTLRGSIGVPSRVVKTRPEGTVALARRAGECDDTGGVVGLGLVMPKFSADTL